MASEAGDQSGRHHQHLANSDGGAHDLSVAQEEQARAVFQSGDGMFMLNWPYVLAAARGAVEDGTRPVGRRRHRFARYPRVFPTPQSASLGGVNLAIGAFSKYPDLASNWSTARAFPDNGTQYMLDEGSRRSMPPVTTIRRFATRIRTPT